MCLFSCNCIVFYLLSRLLPYYLCRANCFHNYYSENITFGVISSPRQNAPLYFSFKTLVLYYSELFSSFVSYWYRLVYLSRCATLKLRAFPLKRHLCKAFRYQFEWQAGWKNALPPTIRLTKHVIYGPTLSIFPSLYSLRPCSKRTSNGCKCIREYIPVYI